MAVSNPPSYLQGGSHPARGLRRMTEAMTGDTEGALAAGELVVSEKSGTPNMSVDVSAGRAFILGTESSFQGTYFVESRGVENLTISAADATNPRKDIVVARVEDSEESGATDAWSLEVIAGTPAASPSAPAQPANSLLLATVDVAALASSITDANITTSTPVWAPAPVDTAGLVDGAVTEAKLAAGSVSSTKLATDSVSAAAIQAGAVGASEIATGAVGASEIATGAVGSTALASGAVTNDKLAASGLDASKITTGTLPSSVLPEIDGSTLGANSVTAAQIATNAVGQSELAANAVDSAHYVDGSIDRVHLAADVIDSTKLADNAVNSEHYVDRSIDAVHIATGAITANELAANSVGNSEMIDSPTFTSVTATTLTANDQAYIGSNGSSDSWTHYYDDNSNDWRSFGWDDSANAFYFESRFVMNEQGTAGVPSMSWSYHPNWGFYITQNTGLGCSINGSTIWMARPSDLIPGSDNTKNLGASAFRWVDVWAVDGSINTSDERFKVRTGDVPGLDFICDLAGTTLRGRWSDDISTEPGVGVRTDLDHFWFGAQSTRAVLDSYGFGEVALVREPSGDDEQWSMAGMEVVPSMAVAIKELRDRVVELEARVEELEAP